MTHEEIEAEDRELRTRRDLLASEVRAISVQLADRDKRDPMTGARLTWQEYQEWRKSALSAQRFKNDELADIKRRLHELSRAREGLKRNGNGASTGNGANGHSEDWKPIVMRALAEAQQARDSLAAAVEQAVNMLASARAGTKAAEARTVLAIALGPVKFIGLDGTAKPDAS